MQIQMAQENLCTETEAKKLTPTLPTHSHAHARRHTHMDSRKTHMWACAHAWPVCQSVCSGVPFLDIGSDCVLLSVAPTKAL